MTETEDRRGNLFSRALVALIKGPINKNSASELWEIVLEQRAFLSDYVAKMGLELCIAETDGYAYLKQRQYADGEDEIPRIVPRHPLSYTASLLLVLLRKKLLEFDASSGDLRLILTEEQMIDMVRVFLKDTTDEAKRAADISRNIERIKEMGFLRKLSGQEHSYEVQRILRSFINAEWMNQVNTRLEEFRLIQAEEDVPVEK
jgi:hypothetical protein